MQIYWTDDYIWCEDVKMGFPFLFTLFFFKKSWGGGSSMRGRSLECLRFLKIFFRTFSEVFQNPILKNPKKALTQPDFWISEVFFVLALREIYFFRSFSEVNFIDKNFWKTFWKHFWKTYFIEITANSHYFTILQIELVWGMFHIIYNPYMH